MREQLRQERFMPFGLCALEHHVHSHSLLIGPSGSIVEC